MDVVAVDADVAAAVLALVLLKLEDVVTVDADVVEAVLALVLLCCCRSCLRTGRSCGHRKGFVVNQQPG